jgi:hypothetical protein
MIIGSVVAAPVLFVFGTVFPAYQTCKAAVSNEAEAMARWLQFWLIMAILSCVQGVIDIVGAYLPFFFEAKIAFILWLSLDKFKGATFLFQKYLKPLLDSHAGKIDEHVDFVAMRLKNFKSDDVRTLADWLSKQDLRNLKDMLSKKVVAKAAEVVEQSSDKPQEPEDDADVVISEPEEEKKAK